MGLPAPSELGLLLAPSELGLAGSQRLLELQLRLGELGLGALELGLCLVAGSGGLLLSGTSEAGISECLVAEVRQCGPWGGGSQAGQVQARPHPSAMLTSAASASALSSSASSTLERTAATFFSEAPLARSISWQQCRAREVGRQLPLSIPDSRMTSSDLSADGLLMAHQPSHGPSAICPLKDC